MCFYPGSPDRENIRRRAGNFTRTPSIPPMKAGMRTNPFLIQTWGLKGLGYSLNAINFSAVRIKCERQPDSEIALYEMG